MKNFLLSIFIFLTLASHNASAHTVSCYYGEIPEGTFGPSPTWNNRITLTGTIAESFSDFFWEDFTFFSSYLDKVTGYNYQALESQERFYKWVPYRDYWKILQWDYWATAVYVWWGGTTHVYLDEESCGSDIPSELIDQYP